MVHRSGFYSWLKNPESKRAMKKERIRRRIYRTREKARADLFDLIEIFYNGKRRHEYLVTDRQLTMRVLLKQDRGVYKIGGIPIQLHGNYRGDRNFLFRCSDIDQ